ncbi:MAG TPA: flippase [Candidatus Thermoplasmatota archaeon]|nr:flippase [Candidatus Thermoplasmatota archaeon]
MGSVDSPAHGAGRGSSVTEPSPVPPPGKALISGAALTRNAAFNIVGQAVPILAGLAAIPILLRGLGPAGFALVSLMWSLLAYFNFFDFGLGRALTRAIARGREDPHAPPAHTLIWDVVRFQLVIAAVAALLVAALSPVIVRSLFRVEADYVETATYCFVILAGMLPCVVLSGAFRGVIEAHQQFKTLNLIRATSNTLSFVLPSVVVLVGGGVVLVFLILLGVQVSATLAYLLAGLQLVPWLRHRAPFSGSNVRSLLWFGGWATAVSIVSPMLLSVDRFLLANLAGLTAVTFFAVPYEFAVRLWIIPASVQAVLFPAFSSNPSEASRLAGRATKYLVILMTLAGSVCIVFSEELLSLFATPEVASVAAPFLQILVLGMIANAFSWVPYVLLQAHGRPDLIAKLYLTELPFRLLSSYFLILYLGVLGAVVAWGLWAAADSLALNLIADRFIPAEARGEARRTLLKASGLWLGFGIALVVVSTQLSPQGLAMKILGFLAVVLAFGGTVWYVLLRGDERTEIRRLAVAFWPRRSAD